MTDSDKPAAAAHWAHVDELGPEKVLYVHRAELDLRGILVIDNTACGPSIGGARMAPDASLRECMGLARAMTLKNAAAGLPHGGGKSVIIADPHMPDADKETLVRAFADAIADLRDYIIGPDMGTDERCMAWARQECGRAVGLPAELGGIPLDELGATGFGVAVAGEVAEQFCDLRIDGARVAIQGFGSVGQHAARFLAERGASIVAVSDSSGGVVNRDGFTLEALLAHKRSGAPVSRFDGGERIAGDDLVAADCDIWIPAARPDAITMNNVDRMRARLVICGANIPASEAVERRLAEKGVLVIPDFIANAGGVICGSVEYHGGTRGEAFGAIEEKITENTYTVLAKARDTGLLPREAATQLAYGRVEAAMSLRRWSRRNSGSD